MHSTLEASPSPVQPTSAAPPAGEQGHPYRWRALGLLLLAAFMDLIDATVVNVAIPSIQRTLSAPYSAIQWVVAGYTLAFALVLITGGRLGDIFGRKRLFMLGVTGFTLASLICGLAQSPEMLIAARLLQGAMGGIMVPQILSIIQVTFPARERGAAFGLYGAVTGLAAVAGPILGGILVEANLLGLEWRPVFLINLFVGAFALIATARVLNESKAPHALRLDVVGMAMITLALLLVLYPLVQGRELGWPTWTHVAMLASLPVFALFALYERHKTRVDNSPLVVLGLFRQRAFVAGLLISITFFAGVSSFFLTYVLTLQIGFGFSPLQSGLTALPFSVGAAVASGASIRWAPKLGRRILSIGTLVMTLGVLGIIFTVHQAGTGLGSWQLVPSLLACGLGMGITVAPLVDIILAGIHGRDAGSASGVLNTTMQLGGTVGIAVIGVVFFSLLSSQAGGSADAVAPNIRAGLQSAGIPAQVQSEVVSGFRQCFQDRMAEKDPSVTPPSCRFEQSAGVNDVSGESGQQSGASVASVPTNASSIGRVVEPAAGEALKRDFATSFEMSLWYQAGSFLLTFFLIFLLPRKAQFDSEGSHPA